MTLQQLQQAERELLAALEDNRKQQRELNTKSFVDKYGIDVGDEVTFTDYFNTKLNGVIHHIVHENTIPIYYEAVIGKNKTLELIRDTKSIKLIKKATKK